MNFNTQALANLSGLSGRVEQDTGRKLPFRNYAWIYGWVEIAASELSPCSLRKLSPWARVSLKGHESPWKGASGFLGAMDKDDMVYSFFEHR